MQRTMSLGFAVITVGLVMAGCASHKGQAVAAKHGTAEVADGSACAKICEASAACGDSPDQCEPKCQDWLVARSRPGIATETARCAVPRIDGVCANDQKARAAATALVTCIDEAGRKALNADKTALLVAARAICERGARCDDRSPEDAASCVEKLTHAPRIPRGLGIFGAMKPALVQRFAQCMSTSACGSEDGGSSSCFGEMLGEESDDGADDDDSTPATPVKPVKPPTSSEDEGPPGTKI